MVPAVALGLYAVAFRIFGLTLSIYGLFFIVVLPIFSRQAKSGRNALRNSFSVVMRQSVPIVLLGTAVIALASKPALELLFGNEFGGAATALQILMVAAAANFLNRGHRQILIALGRNREDFLATAVSTAVNLGSKIILIPMLGLAGAAAATAIGEITLMLSQRRLASRALKEHQLDEETGSTE